MTEPEALPITEAMSAPAAAQAAEEALRQAVHASWTGIATAADVYKVFGAANYCVELVPQLLEQLTTWLEKHAHELSATDDGNPAERIAALRTSLATAVESLDTGRTHLATAQSSIATLYGPLPREHA